MGVDQTPPQGLHRQIKVVLFVVLFEWYGALAPVVATEDTKVAPAAMVPSPPPHLGIGAADRGNSELGRAAQTAGLGRGASPAT